MRIRAEFVAWTVALAALAGGLATAPATAGGEIEYPDHLTVLEGLGSAAAVEILDQVRIPAGTTVHLLPETGHEGNWLIAQLLGKELLARGCTVIAPQFGKDGAARSAPVKGTAPAAGSEPPAEEDSVAAAPGLFDQDEEEAESGQDGAGAGREEGAGTEEELTEEEAQARADSVAAAQPGAGPAGGGARAGRGRRAAAQESSSGGAPAPAAADFDVVLPPSGEALVFRVVECGVSYPWARRSWFLGPRKIGRMAGVRVWASWLEMPGQAVKGVAHSEQVHVDAFPGWARSLLEGQSYPFTAQPPAGAPLRQVFEPVAVGAIVASLVYLFYQNQK